MSRIKMKGNIYIYEIEKKKKTNPPIYLYMYVVSIAKPIQIK